MTTKALVLTLVATGCVAAAGVGGFLAVRVGQGDRVQGATMSSRPDAAGSQAAVTPAPEPVAVSDVRPMSSQQVAAKNAQPTSAPSVSPAGNTTPAAVPETRSATTPATVTPPDPPVTEPVTTATAATEATVVPEPVKPRFEELTLKEESVIGIRLDNAVSTQVAKVEDKVTARVSRDVLVNGRTAIPAGAQLEGVVTMVDRGGKFKNAARLGIRFNSLVLADNTRVPIQTEALTREGSSPGNEATAKVGATAVIGGLIGGLIGGKKGAAVGATAGAAGGTAAVAASDRNDVTLPAGSALTVKLTAPVTLLIEREER